MQPNLPGITQGGVVDIAEQQRHDIDDLDEIACIGPQLIGGRGEPGQCLPELPAPLAEHGAGIGEEVIELGEHRLQPGRLLGEQLTQLGRLPAELPHRLIVGGNDLRYLVEPDDDSRDGITIVHTQLDRA